MSDESRVKTHVIRKQEHVTLQRTSLSQFHSATRKTKDKEDEMQAWAVCLHHDAYIGAESTKVLLDKHLGQGVRGMVMARKFRVVG